MKLIYVLIYENNLENGSRIDAFFTEGNRVLSIKIPQEELYLSH
jgi:hypothetical protein